MVSSVTSTDRTRTAGYAQAVASAKTSGFSDALKSAVGAQSAKKTGLDGIFQSAAEKYHVPVSLLKAVAKAESGFQADAVSSCGAQGIMQLMPSTAASLGVTDSFNPEQNIMGGAKYLGQLLSSFDGSAKLAVAAYNAGSGAVRKYGGVPPYAETQNYVQKVLGYAGGDISVPETAETSNESRTGSSFGTASSGAQENGFSLGNISFSLDDYRLFAQMYVQRLEQSVLEDTAERAVRNGRRTG